MIDKLYCRYDPKTECKFKYCKYDSLEACVDEEVKDLSKRLNHMIPESRLKMYQKLENSLKKV